MAMVLTIICLGGERSCSHKYKITHLRYLVNRVHKMGLAILLAGHVMALTEALHKKFHETA
jgi:hypothetical protein